MFKDHSKFTYVNLAGRRNVYMSTPKGTEPVVTHRSVSVGMLDLIDKLTKKRPMWSFCRGAFSNIFDVYEKEEKLGDITYTGHKYYYSSPLLNKQRERNGSAFTANINTAAAKVLKMFVARTPSDVAGEAFTAARDVVSRDMGRKSAVFSRVSGRIANRLEVYVVENWGTIAPWLISKGSPPEDYPAALRDREESAALLDAVNHARAVTVTLVGDKYLVGREFSTSRDVKFFTADTLSDHLKTALGVLKLLPEKSVVAGIGVRASDTVFLILDPEETP